MAKLISYLRDHSGVLKWLFFAWLLFTIVFDFYATRHGAHFWGDGVTGFWAMFGLAGCLAMTIICKGIYHVWLMKDEDYYDK